MSDDDDTGGGKKKKLAATVDAVETAAKKPVTLTMGTVAGIAFACLVIGILVGKFVL